VATLGHRLRLSKASGDLGHECHGNDKQAYRQSCLQLRPNNCRQTDRHDGDRRREYAHQGLPNTHQRRSADTDDRDGDATRSQYGWYQIDMSEPSAVNETWYSSSSPPGASES